MPEVAELSASRRFGVIVNPVALPGACYTCRNDEGPFIDTGISEDFFGQVLICKNCLLEMIQNFDVPDEKEWSRARRKIKALEESTNILRKENKELQERINGYLTVLDSLNRTDRGLSVDSDNAESGQEPPSEESSGRKKVRQSFLSEASDGSSESDSS